MSADELAPAFSAAQTDGIRQELLDWYRTKARDLPWRSSNDPYHIWLSEIMLQQTRVDQARPYFENFLEAFPSITALAAAPLDDVLIKWEGLGYYSRARNLHAAARQIVQQHAGKVPDDSTSLRALSGIGPYTAAAILSIAFGQSFGVLDGNVIRVLTRLTCNEGDTRKSKTRNLLQSISDALVDPEAPGDFNQAMMELGATICTPHNPTCLSCPVKDRCCAFAAGTMEFFPVSKKKAPLPHYDVAVGIVLNKKNELLIQRRPERGLLGGLWELPGGKKLPDEKLEDACRRILKDELNVGIK